MALEQLANNAQTTTTGAVDGSTDPVTVAVTSAAAFPSAGNFRILIESELLLVTAVAGSNFTCSRAQESTSIASHVSGSTVTHVLTAASLRQVVSEYHLSDVIANRPAAGVTGRLFFPSGGGPTFRDNGATWDIWVEGQGPFVPPLADFGTWVNQAGATIDTSSGFSYLAFAGAGAVANDLHLRVKTLPSNTFTFTMAFHMLQGPGNTGFFGMAMRNSGNSKIFTHHVKPSSNFYEGARWSGASNLYVSSDWIDAMSNEAARFWFLRMRGDGTTFFFDASNDGVNWCNNRQLTIATSYVPAPDQIGFFISPGNSRSNQQNGMSVYHAVLG